MSAATRASSASASRADTAEFAVASIRLWWCKLGRRRYANSKELFITADCGGSNSYRCRLWKVELQAFADQTGLRMRVAHYPPGTSKWNKIEHRLFSQITTNWRGRPLTSYRTVVDLIGATQTTAGLKVYAHLDSRVYQKGREVSDVDMAKLQITRATFVASGTTCFCPEPNDSVYFAEHPYEAPKRRSAARMPRQVRCSAMPDPR